MFITYTVKKMVKKHTKKILDMEMFLPKNFSSFTYTFFFFFLNRNIQGCAWNFCECGLHFFFVKVSILNYFNLFFNIFTFSNGKNINCNSAIKFIQT